MSTFRVKTPRTNRHVEKRDNADLYVAKLDMSSYTQGIDSTNDAETTMQRQNDTRLEYDLFHKPEPLRSMNGGPLSFDTVEVVRDLVIPVNKSYSTSNVTTTDRVDKFVSIPYKLANHHLSNVKVIYSVNFSDHTPESGLGQLSCNIGTATFGPEFSSSYIIRNRSVVADFRMDTHPDLNLDSEIYPIVSLFYSYPEMGEDYQHTVEYRIETVHAFYNKTLLM